MCSFNYSFTANSLYAINVYALYRLCVLKLRLNISII